MSRIPRYQVIYEDLAAQISSGVLGPDAQLPSETLLAERYGVSRMTVRQAVRQLQDQRLLTRRRGAGTFVTAPPPQRHLNRLGTFAEEVGADPARVRSELRGRSTLVPPDDVARRLGLPVGREAVRLERLRLVDDVPAVLQESWVPFALAPLLAHGDLVGGSLYRTLQERHGIRLGWADQEVWAAEATAEQAEALAVPVGSPLLVSSRLTHDEGSVPVELAHGWMRPEFPVVIRLER